MRICALCGVDCGSGIGYYTELRRTWWGGRRDGNVAYEDKRVFFFCSETHRNDHLASGATSGFEIQTDRWENTGDD